MHITAMGKQALLLLSFVTFVAAKPLFLGDMHLSPHSNLEKRATEDVLQLSSLVNAFYAMEIVWACLLGLLLIAILVNLRRLHPASTWAPYILLAIGTLFSVAYYGITAGMERSSIKSQPRQYVSLVSAMSFIYGFGDFFLLTSIIWVIQQRSGTLMNSRGVAVRPITSQSWKRCLDWILVFLVFAFVIISRAYTTRVNLMLFDINEKNYEDAVAKSRAFQHVLVALVSVLLLDIIFSLFLLHSSGRHEQLEDKGTKRLLLIVAPFAALYLVDQVAFDAFSSTWDFTRANTIYQLELQLYGSNLAWIVANGACQFFMILGLVLAMTASPAVDYSGHYGMASSGGLVQSSREGDELKQPHYIRRA